MDARLPLIAAIATVVIAAFLVIRKREIRRLHHERGYDAHDPHIDREAMLNTKAKFRAFNTKSRDLLDVFRGLIFAPLAALLALAFFWAAFPLRWDMIGLGTACALMAWFFTRMLIRGWRAYKSRP